VETPVTRVLVQRFNADMANLPEEIRPPSSKQVWKWRWLSFSTTGQHLWRNGSSQTLVTPVRLSAYEEVEGPMPPSMQLAFEEQMDHDARLYDLIGRLILNTCLAMSDPDNIRQVGSSHKRYAAREDRRQGPPEQRVFQVGKPIQLDCREAVRRFLGQKRAGAKLSVQVLVRGHWKNQPYGPKHTLRRRQWIEPYWKGDSEAPIPVRPHVMEGDNE
jgi:hypothetical protein